MAEAPTQEDQLKAAKAKAAKAAKAKAAREAKKEAEAVEAVPAVAAAPAKPKLRTKGGGAGGQRTTLIDSDVPYPVEVHGDDLENYGPQGMFSKIPAGVETADYSVDQEFIVDEEALKTLKFLAPGQNLPATARLYNVKGIHRDGRVVQLPFEDQINNTAGGDPEDAIGLRRYARKGIKVLIDWDTLLPIYCAAWECWAQADNNSNHPGFCSTRHAVHTLPNTYKDSGAMLSKMFGDATTSRTWSV